MLVAPSLPLTLLIQTSAAWADVQDMAFRRAKLDITHHAHGHGAVTFDGANVRWQRFDAFFPVAGDRICKGERAKTKDCQKN